MSWTVVAVLGAILTAAAMIRLIIRLAGGGASESASSLAWLSNFADSCASSEGDCDGGGVGEGGSD